MIEMKVSGVILDSASRHPIVMLRDMEERRALLIWIGEPEANAILMALEGIQAPRPMTHDLAVTLLDKLKATLKGVRITAMRDQTFFAELDLEVDGKATTVDARPSDAIALALRCEAAILVSPDVITANAIPINPAKEEEEAEQFRQFLQNVKPGDFGKFNKD
ncbi:MAG: bifunctional nuclease family protein [Candidatus Sericytochromatia bacterium]|nr:bifunctional nuclease family protein [Candidatus Sericytochromatia bacterium]